MVNISSRPMHFLLERAQIVRIKTLKYANAIGRRVTWPIWWMNILLLRVNGSVVQNLLNDLNWRGSSLFIPYQAPDCLVIHRGILNHLKRIDNSSALVDAKKLSIDIYEFLKIDVGSPNNIRPDLSNFEQILAKIKDALRENNISVYYYPLIDYIIRVIRPEYMFQRVKLDERKLLYHVGRLVEYAEKCAKRYQNCVLADSAYLINGVFKTVFIMNGKSVFYLNPNGKVDRLRTINNCEGSIHNENLYDVTFVSQNSKQYLKKRFQGNDLDRSVAKAFRSNKTTSNYEYKKVLFLHAFRDANNTTWRENQPFDSFIEWTDFTLDIISKTHGWHDWLIKPHPGSRLYENDEDIFSYFMSKYNVPFTVYNNLPSTLEVLEAGCPIFTNRGTIVLESLAFGYKSIFCGPRFQQQLGLYCESKNSWRDHLNMNIDILSSLCSADKGTIIAGKHYLWKLNGYKNIPEICPDQEIIPNDSAQDYLLKSGSQFRNILLNQCGLERFS
jgi:hypothetical protein